METNEPLIEKLQVIIHFVSHRTNWFDGLAAYSDGWFDHLSGHRCGKNVPAQPGNERQ